ncbi:hypothetical protein FHS31_003182 [Sphingomonas vulcanisoli]|uniref:Uncharacterized protein n=1 Tax=Sphingomonas vulcanisoli TaxID=1658060 RepID=A0ABX0TVI9_9SPHN|nr:hypothetical protein [Sphingomonas vulcanisoli]
MQRLATAPVAEKFVSASVATKKVRPLLAAKASALTLSQAPVK